jgi:lysozyme family protein
MNFDTAFHKLHGHEGDFTDDHRDPGNWTGGRIGVGELKGTKFGIAANTYPNEDIRGLTIERAKQIYRRDFWDQVRAEELPAQLRYPVFDAAVNSGVRQSIRWLQRAVGATDDGVFGPMTMLAVKQNNADVVVRRLLSQRLRFMTGLSNWPAHGRGWARRIADLMENS